MTRMVQVAMAGDVTEAEELQTILRSAGIDVRARVRGRPRSARDRGRSAEGAGARGVARGGAARDRGAHRAGGDRRRSLISGGSRGSYDELRPADDNWWEVFELLVREGDLVGRRVLDIGCGTGRAAEALVERGSRVWGVEPRAGDGRARAGAREHGQGRAGRAAAVQGRLVRARADVARRPPRRPARARSPRRRACSRPDGRLAIVTFHPRPLRALLAEARSSRRSRRSTRRGSRRPTELDVGARGGRLRARRAAPADANARRSTATTALERVRGALHLAAAAPRRGRARSRASRGWRHELPERNEYTLEWLVAVAYR